jgi:hypothetical protein
MENQRALYSHRANANGSYDSICMNCFRTVVTQDSEAELSTREATHVCGVEDLYNANRNILAFDAASPS